MFDTARRAVAGALGPPVFQPCSFIVRPGSHGHGSTGRGADMRATCSFSPPHVLCTHSKSRVPTWPAERIISTGFFVKDRSTLEQQRRPLARRAAPSCQKRSVLTTLKSGETTVELNTAIAPDAKRSQDEQSTTWVPCWGVRKWPSSPCLGCFYKLCGS